MPQLVAQRGVQVQAGGASVATGGPANTAPAVKQEAVEAGVGPAAAPPAGGRPESPRADGLGGQVITEDEEDVRPRTSCMGNADEAEQTEEVSHGRGVKVCARILGSVSWRLLFGGAA